MKTFQKGSAQTYWMLAVAVIALAAGSYSAWKTSDKTAARVQTKAATVLNPPKAMPDFELIDGDGRPLGKAQLQGHWSLLFFGYTQCPDVCPTTLAVMSQVAKEIPADKLAYIFVSVDPGRDTPEQLKQFTRYFNAGFLAATGSEEALDPLLRSLGVVHRIVPGQSEDDYLVDHSAALFVINPHAELTGVISAPHLAADIAHDLKLMMETL